MGDVDDQDLMQAFQNYTQLMIDLALISEDSMFNYDPKIQELVKIYKQRISLMKKTQVFQNQYSMYQLMGYDTKNGGQKGEISLVEGIILPIRKMMLSSEMGNLEIYESLEKVDKYIQDEDSVLKLLYYCPTFKQGISIIAEGLFSNNKEIVKITQKILTKVQKCELGAIAVQQNLTLFHTLKLSKLTY